MKTIQKNDVVGLTRSLDGELFEGLVGVVVDCHADGLEVKFPLQGSAPLYAKVSLEDVRFLMGNLAAI